MICSGRPSSSRIHEFCRGWQFLLLFLLPQMGNHHCADNEEQDGADCADAVATTFSGGSVANEWAKLPGEKLAVVC